ncbi:MAG: F0F1 ATP synthase subunit B [Eubacteriales bacterium]
MEGLDIAKIPMDLLLNLLNIIILYIIIRVLVYKPVKKFLDDRIDKVNALSEKAEQAKSEADKLVYEFEKLLAGADEKSNEIILASQKKASDEAASTIAEAKKESDAIFNAAKAKIDEERETSLKTMKKEVAALAVDISKKLLAREINDSDNLKIAQEFFVDSVSKK